MTILTPEVRALLKRMDADDAIDKAVELALEAARKACLTCDAWKGMYSAVMQQQVCADAIEALKAQK